VELTLYVALCGLLFAAAFVGHHWLGQHAETNYQRGLAAKQLEWDQDKDRAAEAQRRKDAAVAGALLVEEKRRLAAEDAARDANAQWEEARREARRNARPLAVCPQPRLQGAADVERDAGSRVPGAGVERDRPAVPGAAVFTWQFVREYDTAWTGADGKPVSQDPAGQPGAADAGAPSPFTAEDVLDVHGTNARRCSEDRRELATLRARLETAADAIDKGDR
jgi:hypothetical protein